MDDNDLEQALYSGKDLEADTSSGGQVGQVSDRDIFTFARSILLGIAILFLVSMFAPNPAVFDAAKTILPPIAALVIGFYFADKR